jgi:aryl-alcohol dehydrogenase-like predicted oxidoreductase
MLIPTRVLGRTGVEVTRLGLGGEGVLRTFGYDGEAVALIHRALDLGVNYFESARVYSGSESYYGKALKGKRSQVFLTSKSHARDRREATAHLEETLRNMQTDYLDLWQVHDVRTAEEVEEIFGPGGAIEAFVQARQKGQVRFIGLTGHHDPDILVRCLEIFDFDTVLVPVNPAEPTDRSFIHTVIPVARKKDMGVIGMKVYFRGFASRLPWFSTLEPFVRYALSQDVSTVVIGCDSLAHIEENVGFAKGFVPMSDEESQQLVEKLAPYARSLMYYKP